MSLQTDLEQAIARVQQDSQTLHAIVHGDKDTVVTTEGGDVSSPAKVIGDVERAMQAALDNVSQSLSILQTAMTQTQQQLTFAQTQAQGVLQQANTLNLPTSLQGHSGAVLSVSEDESGYTFTPSQTVFYGLRKTGAKLFVHVGGDYYDMAKVFSSYLLALPGIGFQIDERGHLLMTV